MRVLGRWLGRFLLIAVALAALVVGCAWLFLQTDAGGRLVLSRVLPRVNAALAGRLEAARFAFGGDSVELTDVTIRDPEGDPVAEIDRLRVAFSPLSLLRSHVVLTEVDVERPVVTLRQDHRGLNLSRALAPRDSLAPREDAATARPDGGDRTLVVRVGRLSVKRGVVDVRVSDNPSLRHLRFEQLTVKGDGRFDAAARSFAGKVAVEAQGRRPLAAPLALSLDADGRVDALTGRLKLTFGHSRVDLAVDGESAQRLAVRIGGVTVAPELARVFLPDYPISTALTLTGDVSRAGDEMTGDVTLRVGPRGSGGEVVAKGSLDLKRRRSDGIEVRGRGLDLSVVTGGPRSAIAFALDARGGGRDLSSLDGAVSLDVPPSRLQGRVLGPVRLRASADRGRYKVADLSAVLPGVKITGQGEATERTVSFAGRIVAADLGATVRSFDGPGRPRLPVVAGRGQIDVAIAGPLAQPRLTATGTFPHLRYEAHEVAGLTLSAQVPDLRTPQRGSSLRLKMARANLGGRDLRTVTVAVGSQGPLFSLAVSVAAPEALAVNAAGRWTPRFDGLTLTALGVRYAEGRWSLAAPVRIAFPDGRVAVEGLDLRSGRQRVRASFALQDARMKGQLAIAAFDLRRLPRALVPPEVKLRGLVDAQVAVAGTTARPDVRARVSVADGRFKEFANLGLALDARYANRRAVGTMTVEALSSSLQARFDAPAAWPMPAASPLTLDVKLDEVELPALLEAVGPGRPARQVAGRVGLHLAVSGTVARPQVTLTATGRGLAADNQPIGDVTLKVSGVDDRPLDARVDIRAFGRDSYLTVVTRFTPGTLLRRPPPLAKVLDTPVEITAVLDALPLSALAKLASYGPKVGGTVSARVAIKGPPRSPTGSLSVRVVGATTGRFPPTDADVDLSLDRQVTAKVRVVRRDAVLLALDGTLAAPAARLRDLDHVASAPLRLAVKAGPYELQRLGVPPESERDAPRVMKGRARAELLVEGTLRDPRLTLTAVANDVRLNEKSLGQASARLAYARKRVALELGLDSVGGGTLRASADVPVDLSYPRFKQPYDVETLLLSASLRAQGLDLTGFSGAVESLRTVAGRLDATASVRGTVGDPRIDGHIEWKDGILAITGFGEYREVHMLVKGNQQGLVLEDLSARSGRGKARLTARADRAGADKDGLSQYTLTVRANMNDFPLYTQGQALATVSVEANVAGKASAKRVNADVRIDEAHLTLADGKRKNLQDLQRPDDIILFRDGEPLNKTQARRLQELIAAREADERAGRETARTARVSSKASVRQVRLTVNAPRNLWVKGNDANLELGLGPNFLVTITDQPRMFGEVRVRRGRIDVFGRRFDLKAGSTVRFSGPIDTPILDVTATHVNNKVNPPLTILVSAKGPSDALKLTLSSPTHPELNETQMYTAIITGRVDLAQSSSSKSTPGAQAASIVGGLLAAQLQKTLAAKLPLDVLTIDTGDGLRGTALEAGTYLTDDLYVAYVGRLGVDPFRRLNRNEVRLEYQLTSRWSFEGMYGDAKTGTADIVWTKHY